MHSESGTSPAGYESTTNAKSHQGLRTAITPVPALGRVSYTDWRAPRLQGPPAANTGLRSPEGNTAARLVMRQSSNADIHCVPADGLYIFTYDLPAGASFVVETPCSSAYMLSLGLEGVARLVRHEAVTPVSRRDLELRLVEGQITIASKLGASGVILLVSADLLQQRVRKLRKRRQALVLPVEQVLLSGPTGSAAARLLADCLAGAADHMGTSGVLTTDHRTCELIFMLLLEAIEERIAPPAEEQEEARVPWYVTAVERHLATSITEPVSVTDLAQLVGLSARTLHEGFRKHRGCSPMRFVREQRMALIRRELSEPSETTTVTDSALKWGFNHLGRFSSYYLGRFGERPSDTLRKGRVRVENSDVEIHLLERGAAR